MVILKLPFRRLRSVLLHYVSLGQISKYASFARGVTILNVRGITIGARTNVNSGVILDGRGANLQIGENVDIAPRTAIWTLEHELDSPRFVSKPGPVVIRDYVWIGSGVIILPNTELGFGCVIGAGSVFKGTAKASGVYLGRKAEFIRARKINNMQYRLTPIRRFR